MPDTHTTNVPTVKTRPEAVATTIAEILAETHLGHLDMLPREDGSIPCECRDDAGESYFEHLNRHLTDAVFTVFDTLGVDWTSGTEMRNPDGVAAAREREWAVESPTYVGGEFDRRITAPSVGRPPFTEEAARKYAEEMTRSRYDARVASREVGPWEPVVTSGPVPVLERKYLPHDVGSVDWAGAGGHGGWPGA
ncbi:hypothetical protein ACFVAJ_17830 [Agromyces sp. NPDC057679]|uniref:hypothetical protein n=1 Tax=Agromyces sp. NPDC057679 TaxID=3346207 RepID=UPI00366E867E